MNAREPKAASPESRAAASEQEDRVQGEGKKPKKEKSGKAKRSFIQSTRDHLVTVYGLGRTLVQEPRSFPGELKLHLLEWARGTWNARGGGFYACGFVITFLFLEIRLLVTELFTSAGAGDFILEQAMQLVFRFTVDSLVNTLLALIWPALFLSHFAVNGLILLGVGYLVFNRFLKGPLTRLLFSDDG